jgi:hypothetical protein
MKWLQMLASPALAAVAVLLQTPETGVARAAASVTDESFDLDIAEKRISRPDFHASTALKIEPTDGSVRIHAGASVTARSVEIVLRNVRGSVRFHSDMGRLENVLRPAPPAGPAIPPPDQQ